MIDQLKDLKDSYEAVRSQIDKLKEPLQELIVLQNFLKAVADDPMIFQEKMDKDYKRYFLEDFTQGMLKRLTKEKSKNEKYLQTIGFVLENFLLIFAQQMKQGNYSFQFFDSIRQIFDYDSILHQIHYQIPEEELKKIRNTNQPWRNDLKVGDMVDAIQDEYMKCPGWSQAQIASIAGDILQLEFIYDTKNVDKYLDRWSVDIAPFESKTKELFEWKKNLTIKTEIDGHDKSTWYKSTILDIKEQTVSTGRTIKMAFVAFRVYVEKSNRSDELGFYDGWSNKFDEWVCIYSPRIQPFFSKTQKGIQEDIDIDEDLDALFTPEEGHSKLYAVPRLRKCTSQLYIHLINQFGNKGGFEAIQNVLQKAQNEDIDFNIVAVLIECASKPWLVYHQEFQKQFAPMIVDFAENKIKNIPDKILREIKREKLEAIIKSIDNLKRRHVQKNEREYQIETIRLDICLQCIRSNYLDRKIQGLKDLNKIIQHNRFSMNKILTNAFLIQWMHDNDVFSVLLDNKKTHLQIVQRCADILKLLLQENQLTIKLTEMFWNLSKSDYKPEVYKIVNDGAAVMKQEHIDFIFEQITQIPPEKLTLEEYSCLSELGKHSKDEDFKKKVLKFFWKTIDDSDLYKDELVTSSIEKFSQLVKGMDLLMKLEFCIQLTKNIGQKKSSIASIQLFVKLLKDHQDKIDKSQSLQQEYQFETVTYPPQTQGDTAIEDSEVNGTSIQKNPVNKVLEQDQGFTIRDLIEKLVKEHNLITIWLDNFSDYCIRLNQFISQAPSQIIQENNRKKQFFLSQKYSHYSEICERLNFLKFIAFISDFKISKMELGVIYDLLVIKSKIPSDYEEFLVWCKASCEQSSASVTILDLNEVGEFFIEKINNKELDIKNLLMVGFEFLQHYFLSVNEKDQKLLKSVKKKEEKQPKNNQMMMGMGMGFFPQPKGFFQKQESTKPEEKQDEDPIFKLLKPTSELSQVEIIWKIALECINDKVYQKAINFLIKIYTCLDEDLDSQKIQIQDQLIAKCMELLKNTNINDEFRTNRILEILKNIIFEAEKKGTGDVQPHNAILKGELLEKINIKNKATTKKGNIIMSIYSNTTVWEFRKQIAKQLDLAPKYLKLERQNGKIINNLENGKTLAYLGIQSEEQVFAYKQYVEEEIANAPLIGSDNKLTEKAKQIFNEWFTAYSDQSGSMTKETCALFIRGCTGEFPSSSDERIVNLFKAYDSNNDGKIEREEFMTFFENSSKSKEDTVRENLRAHNIRNDLKKLSEIMEESSFTKEDMPRYKISKNQTYFDLLMSILDRQDSSSIQSWDLIQMLATNQVLYRRVLELQTAMDSDAQAIDWSKFFDTHSVYKLLYTLQIVQSVMEDGEGNITRVFIIVQEEAGKIIPKAPPLLVSIPPPENSQGIQINSCEKPQEKVENLDENIIPEIQEIQRKKSIVENEDADKELRITWTKMFLKYNGFQYILNVFMNKEISSISTSNTNNFNETFDLIHSAFLLKLLRYFIIATFDSIRNEKESQDGSQTELTNLLKGEIGQSILQQIDYKQFQFKLLKTISIILQKDLLVFEDKIIIEHALNLIVGCILHKNDLLQDFYQFIDKENPNSKIQNCQDLIIHGLLYCNYEKVRSEFRSSFGLISQSLQYATNLSELPLEFLIKVLCSKFSVISQYPCQQYFELFCYLMDLHFENDFLKGNENQIKSKDQEFDPKILLVQIIDKIKEYNKLQSEKEQLQQDDNSQDDFENIYIGLIKLTQKIIDNFDIKFSEEIVEQKSLIDEIFVKFLFASVFTETSTNDTLQNINVKKKSIQKHKKFDDNQKQGQQIKKSKEAAYKLLNSLIKKSPILMNTFLEKSMVPLMDKIRRINEWNYTPPGSSERIQKYVGLRNLGCICYMNSMLQQFFMIPSFRYNLLCVDDHLPEDMVDYKGVSVDDNVLHQFQKLIAHLELSNRQDYDPFEFCFAFKDFDGQPTNTGEQKDAQEFLNLIFERVETLLKPTSRKYLLQSIFGGQTCSQMVCQECGKVRNRIEDFYNLSLPVKDIKSMEASLQKMIEGEVINDFLCDGCNKKVDISKRTLISQTPNVLIVHLQRIIFNFDTFKNDKINSFWEFPSKLDLKPYSFYEVMNKENRLKTKKNGEDEEQEQENVNIVNDEDNQFPAEEDCFEYKLVGVNVHSGTANAGHYWSYINTQRGFTELDSQDPNWEKTENDVWMEFNDSTVKDFNFSKLKEDCFGGDKKSSAMGGMLGAFSFDSDSYGKSAYMLVYERRKKRPIKIVLEDSELEESKNNINSQVQKDEKKNEFYKLIDYKDGVEEIRPNQIYKQVFEDNMKFEFENEIYSQEFFDFVNGILKAVNLLNQQFISNEHKEIMTNCKENALKVGKKAILEIVAKCFYNKCITEMMNTFIQLFKQEESLCRIFMEQCYFEDEFDYIFTLLLECLDTEARSAAGMLIKHILQTLKLQEKNILYEKEIISKHNEKGEMEEKEVYSALSSRFFVKCLSILNTKVAKNWTKFDVFLDVIFCFAMYNTDSFLPQIKDIDKIDDAESLEAEKKQQELKLELEQIGLEFCQKQRFIEKICDFVLGKKSPLFKLGEKRQEMGGSYSAPNFSALIKIITRLITDEALLNKFPMTDLEKSMFLQHDLLKVMLGSSSGSKQFGKCLANMCKDNYKLSKKVAKVFVKSINNANFDTVKNYLTALKPFIKTEDSLKQIKLEWVFGYSQIVAKKGYREEKFKYGLETIQCINEDAYEYVSPLVSGPIEDPLLGQLLKCKGRLDTFAVNCLKEMLSLMVKDDQIARYIYRQAPPTYQFSRYIDWIKPYLELQRQETEKNASYTYMKNKYETILKAISLYTEFLQGKMTQYYEEDRLQMEKQILVEQKFQGTSDNWFAYSNNEILRHFPPQLIIGKQICGEEEKEFYVNDEDPNVKIVIHEIINEYNYSNPNCYFNISIPHIEFRTSNYQTMSYVQFKQLQYREQMGKERLAQEQSKENIQTQENQQQQQQQQQQDEQTNGQNIQTDQTAATENSTATVSETEQVQTPQQTTQDVIYVQTINWEEKVKQGPILLRITAIRKTKKKVTVQVSFTSGQPLENEQVCNVYHPISFFKETFSTDGENNKCLGHLQKIDPSQPWGKLQVNIKVIEKEQVPQAPNMNGNVRTGSTDEFTNAMIVIGNVAKMSCGKCTKLNELSSQLCVDCGNPMHRGMVSISLGTGDGDNEQDNYFDDV